MRTHRIQARKTLIRGCSLRYPSFCETAIRSILTPFGKIFCGGLNAFIHASQLAGSFLECVVEKEWGWAAFSLTLTCCPRIPQSTRKIRRLAMPTKSSKYFVLRLVSAVGIEPTTY